jgi:hypothetical protein
MALVMPEVWLRGQNSREQGTERVGMGNMKAETRDPAWQGHCWALGTLVRSKKTQCPPMNLWCSDS